MMIGCHQKGQPYEKVFETENFKGEEQRVTRQVKRELEEEFHILLSQEEEQYIKWVLHMGMIQDTSSVYTVKNRILDSKIHTFIEYVEDRMGLQLIRDKELKESLYVHIERALTRIRGTSRCANEEYSFRCHSYYCRNRK